MAKGSLDVDFLQSCLSKVWKVSLYSADHNNENSIGNIKLIFSEKEIGYTLLYYFVHRLREQPPFVSITLIDDSNLEIEFDARDYNAKFKYTFSRFSTEEYHKFRENVNYVDTIAFVSVHHQKLWEPESYFIHDKELSESPLVAIKVRIHTLTP